MTTLDIIVLIIFVGALILGARKGIILQVGSLGGIVLGVIACRLACGDVAQWLENQGYIGADAVSHNMHVVLANVVVFVVVYLGAQLIAHLFKTITHALALGFVDRLAGAVFSAFKWMLALSLVFNLWLLMSPKTDFASLCPLANGHAIETILALGPCLLGWAVGS